MLTNAIIVRLQFPVYVHKGMYLFPSFLNRSGGGINDPIGGGVGVGLLGGVGVREWYGEGISMGISL